MGDSPVAIITGAGSGIGRAAAILLAQRGYDLALVGRRVEPLRETASLAGRGLVAEADITDAAACERVISTTESEFGRIDALINNAGSAPLAPIEKSTAALIRDAFAINAHGPAFLIHFVWPVFTRQKCGCIVNISTMGTIDPFQGFFAYAAAKASVNLMAKSCAKEGKSRGIRAFAVAPGAVETGMLRSNFPEKVLPASKTLSPESVAQVILDCIEGRRDADNGGVIAMPPP